MDMIKMIGKAARNGFLVAFFNALQKEDTKLDMTLENFISYAIPIMFNEFTIPVWEKWLGLSQEITWTLQDRIERIIYTINSNQSCTEQFLKEQANIFTNGEIAIEQQFALYNFIIQFTSMIGTPPNIDNFRQMVDINKPAHLTYNIKYRYRTWGELEPFTWEQLEKYTWQQLYEEPILT
ncbi:putative phage tail protein [Fusobacterium necrogenes]|uniref:putative phage tail protein n=1 Tax=Fusobacterium necrogenes TaxID=858 RepID=UPI00255C715E|nr:putative phage tail protein [Fusobacterium necrogenes]